MRIQVCTDDHGQIVKCKKCGIHLPLKGALADLDGPSFEAYYHNTSECDPRKAKKFRLQDKDGNDVLGGLLYEDNVYVSTYGVLVRGKKVSELEVDESCVKRYALSGQKPTEYWIVRVE